MAGFRFAPRALLELGKELISSDEVALYELIKNSVDARKVAEIRRILAGSNDPEAVLAHVMVGESSTAARKEKADG